MYESIIYILKKGYGYQVWSLNYNLSCFNFKLLGIALKFLFKISISLSAFNSGTLVFKLPIPISFEADIKLLIEIKNLDENLIAIVIDKNNKSVTIII